MAGRTWDEMNAEAQKSMESNARAGSLEHPDAANGADTSTAESDGLEWLDLWGIERSSLPQWLKSWQANDNAVGNKIRNVIKQEWEFMESRDVLVARDGDQGVPSESGLPPPGPPLLDKTGRFFDIGAYIAESTVFPFVLMESFMTYSDPKRV